MHLVQHADGHFFAVNVTVSRVSGSGMDSSYMGLLEVSRWAQRQRTSIMAMQQA